jgi:hypothetical protein
MAYPTTTYNSTDTMSSTFHSSPNPSTVSPQSINSNYFFLTLSSAGDTQAFIFNLFELGLGFTAVVIAYYQLIRMRNHGHERRREPDIELRMLVKFSMHVHQLITL